MVCSEDMFATAEKELGKIYSFNGAVYNPVALDCYH